MSIFKSTAVALLMSITVLPALGMEEIPITTSHELEHHSIVSLLEQYRDAKSEVDAERIVSDILKILSQRADRVQARLASHRAFEMAQFSARAYRQGGFEHTRLYQFIPGVQTHKDADERKRGEKLSEHEKRSLEITAEINEENQREIAAAKKEGREPKLKSTTPKFDESIFNRTMKTLENELREIHALISQVEQLRQIRGNLDKKSHKEDFRLAKPYQDALEKAMSLAQKFDATKEEALSEDEINFLNKVDVGHCPDKEVVGKKVFALLPHFSKDTWASGVDMRTGIAKAPVATIRLQNKLWDIYPGRTKKENAPHMPYMGPGHVAQQGPALVFLPRQLLSSKRCEYTFEETIQTYMPYYRNEKVRYSAIFIPSGQEKMEPRDRAYDEVKEELRLEIEGEGFKVPDVNNPEESRRAVSEEMDQRLGRRMHDKYMREETGYLKPSQIRSQTYRRVHVPNYHYNRAYGRMYDIIPVQGASPREIEIAKSMRDKAAMHSGIELHSHGQGGRSTVPQDPRNSNN